MQCSRRFLSLNFFLVFLSPALYAQENPRVLLKGKVVAATDNLEGIEITNLQTEKSTLTKHGGYFTIIAKNGDSLRIASVEFKATQIVLENADFEKDLYFLRLEPSTNMLSEVKIINYSRINAVDLGIIPATTKRYTPAERRLRTAGDLKPTDFLGLLGGAMPIDPIMNAINGRTARLKKELQNERKEMLIARLEVMFEDSFYIDYLKIPTDYIKGFLYYVADNDELRSILNDKNKTMLSFVLSDLAVKYLDTISLENK